jgi:hypothetical protein
VSRKRSDRIPPDLVDEFDGEHLEEGIGRAFILATTDVDGTPRPCMLSVGEILIADERRIRVLLWAGTHTAANLDRGSRALLCYVGPGSVLYMKGSARRIGPRDEKPFARFEVAVESVESDAHPGMPVIDTIRFAVAEQKRVTVLDTWRDQIDRLR